MSSAVQFGSLPQDVPAATPEGVFLVHNRTLLLLLPPRPNFEANKKIKHLIIVHFVIVDAVRRPPVLPWPDIGHLAKWSVSSFKFGFGPECLQDQDPDTFWQLSPTLSHSTRTHLSLSPTQT